jgi:carbohydrate-binding DOMON domain-containing protein
MKNSRVFADGVSILVDSSVIQPEVAPDFFAGMSFAEPFIRPDLPALRGPSYPLLPHESVKADNGMADILINADDPGGDDKGNGEYEYPTNPHFLPGCLDIVGFRLGYDSVNAYFRLRFRSLSDPGWHPEYGFQLTFAAIALDKDRVSGSGNSEVGHNSSYRLGGNRGYERLLLVGGGIRLEDGSGKILAAYIPHPADISKPIGNIGDGTISFAVPISLLGKPEKNWLFTVLIGAQDDHGGAGLGEFRTVNETAGEWTGGGKVVSAEPNVYDILEVSGDP